MSNSFLYASIYAVNRNGIDCNYIKTTLGAYDVETGSASKTEVNYPVRMYKKHLKTNQYSYPNLIGKDVGIFYIANENLAFIPSPKDKILYNGSTFIVDSFEEGLAHSQIVLYKIVAVKA